MRTSTDSSLSTRYSYPPLCLPHPLTTRQAAHPGRVITPQEASETFAGTRGTMDTIDTPLTPFRKSSGQLFTSTDVSSASSIWSYGYAYPEVPVSYRTRSSSSLTTFVNTQINRLYRSTSSRKRAAKAGPKREWLCHFMFSPSEMEGESSQLEIYLGDSTTSDGTFVGSGAAMGKKSLTPKDHQKLITAVVPLTAALEDAGIDVGNKRDVARYLRDHLRWYMKKVHT